jgi:hypothetical protein
MPSACVHGSIDAPSSFEAGDVNVVRISDLARFRELHGLG